MKACPLALLFFTSVSPLLGASVTDRLNRLENEVSELQVLVKQLSKRGSSQQTKPRSQSNGTYVVRSGDSYWKIARRLNISVSDLENANPSINPRRLGIGKVLNVPGTSRQVSTSPPSTATGASGTYRVKQGDILGRISEAHGIRLHELMTANPGLDPRRLKVGTILKIPGQAKQASDQPASKPGPAPRPEKQAEQIPPTVARASQRYSSQGVEQRRNPYQPSTEHETRRFNYGATQSHTPEPRLVPVSRDSRLGEIAKLHNTTVAHINKLNDVELSPEQMIRSGSQLYVPGR